MNGGILRRQKWSRRRSSCRYGMRRRYIIIECRWIYGRVQFIYFCLLFLSFETSWWEAEKWSIHLSKMPERYKSQWSAPSLRKNLDVWPKIKYGVLASRCGFAAVEPNRSFFRVIIFLIHWCVVCGAYKRSEMEKKEKTLSAADIRCYLTYDSMYDNTTIFMWIHYLCCARWNMSSPMLNPFGKDDDAHSKQTNENGKQATTPSEHDTWSGSQLSPRNYEIKIYCSIWIWKCA